MAKPRAVDYVLSRHTRDLRRAAGSSTGLRVCNVASQWLWPAVGCDLDGQYPIGNQVERGVSGAVLGGVK